MIHELLELVAKLGEARVLVVGDLMLDRYIWASVDRISPEAPIPVAHARREDALLGGAANVANNLAALGVKTMLCGLTGSDDAAVILRKGLKERKINAVGVIADKARVTTVKTRVLAQNQQLLRIDHEKREPVSKKIEDSVLQFVHKSMDAFDVLVISDYAKGLLTDRVISGIIGHCSKAGKRVIVDPKGKEFSKYKGASVLTPNRHEAAIASGMDINTSGDIDEAGRKLLGITKSEAIIITCGKDGMVVCRKRRPSHHLPTLAREVFDVTGAGDSVIAVLASAMAVGADLDNAARLANLAGGIVVGKMGASPVSKQELSNALHDKGLDHNIFPTDQWKSLKEQLGEERRAGNRIVFTNGCFDLIHSGHIKLLQDARKFGEILVVGVNTDKSVRSIKGPKRPVLGETERAHILASLDAVDYVVLFNETTPLRLIGELKPDVLVKGDDYKKNEVVGAKVVEKYGGEVRLVPVVPGFSTTNIVQRIVERFGESGNQNNHRK